MEHSAYFRSMFSKFKEKSLASIELKDITDSRLMAQVKVKERKTHDSGKGKGKEE